MDDAAARLAELSATVENLQRQVQALYEKATGSGLDEQIVSLLQKVHNGNPTYAIGVASFFREYEMLQNNVKQLGFHLGRQEIERTGVAGRLRDDLQPVDTLLGSKLCTQTDCESDWMLFWLKRMKLGFVYHRKLWEFCYIAQQLHALKCLEPERIGLGFGCGEEPLASLWATFDTPSVSTDLDPATSAERQQGWIEAGAHASSREKLLHRNICPDEKRLELISHDFADMNDIPQKFFGQYDFCWSSCAFEHLGSIEKGLQFIENSMLTLKPGGISVHTTEFNLDDRNTIDNWSTVLFQRRHLEQLRDRLAACGHEMLALDFEPGGGVLDGLFDVPPWPWDAAQLNWKMLHAYAHLKKSIDGVPCTSIGITVRKRRSAA